MDPLDALALDLRERLLATAGGADEDLVGRIRALVDREAGVLSEERREPSWSRGSPSGRSGSGRWSRCWPIRRSTRSWCRAARPSGSSAPGGWRARACASSARRICATRSSASSRRWAAARTRPSRSADARLPDGSRINVVLPPLALDGPALTIRRFRRRGFAPGGPGGERDADAAAARVPRARRARAGDRAGLRRHRLRQDDDVERAVVVRGRERARGHDRGRRRAAAAPAARGPVGGPAAEPRGPRRGDDPAAGAQRAADAAGPDHRRRGPRRQRRWTC